MRRPRRESVAAAACCLAVSVVVSAARTTQMTHIDDNYVPLNSLTIKALYENSTAESTGSSHWWTQIESFQNSKTQRRPSTPPVTSSWNESASTAERIQMQALLDKFLSIYGETRVGGEPEVRPAQLKNALVYLANQFSRDPRPSAESALISAALQHLDASFGDDFTYDDSTTPPNKRAVIWSVVERALAKYRLVTTTTATTTKAPPTRTSPWTTQRWFPTTTTTTEHPDVDEEGKKLPSFYPQLAAASAVSPLEADSTPKVTRNNSKVFSVKTNSSSISLDDLLRLRSTTTAPDTTSRSKSGEAEGPHVGLGQHSIGEAGEANGNVVSPFLYEGPHPHIGFRHINKVSSPSSPNMENVTNAFLTTSPFLVQLEQNKPDVNYTSLKLIDSPFLQTTPKALGLEKDLTKDEEEVEKEADDYYEEKEEVKEQADEVEEEWPRSGLKSSYLREEIAVTSPPPPPPRPPGPSRQGPIAAPVPSWYPQLSNHSLAETSESAFQRHQLIESPSRPNLSMTMQSDLQQGGPLSSASSPAGFPNKIRSSSIFEDKEKVTRFASSLNSFIQGLESNLNTSLGSGNLIISLENPKRQPAKDVSLTPGTAHDFPTLVKIVNYKNGSLDFVTRSSQGVPPGPTPSRTSPSSSSRPSSPLAPSRAQQIAAAVAAATAAVSSAAPASPTASRRRKTATRTSTPPRRSAAIPAPSALKSELGALQFPVNIKSGLKPPSALSALFGPGVDMMMRQHPFTQDVTSSGPIDLPAQLRIHGNLNRYLHQQQPEVEPPPPPSPTEADLPPVEASLGEEVGNPLNDDALFLEALLRTNFSAPPPQQQQQQQHYNSSSRPDRVRQKDIFDREDPAKLRAKLDELEELRLQNKVLLSLLQMQGAAPRPTGTGGGYHSQTAESSRSQRIGGTHFKTPPVIEPLASIENGAAKATDFTILQPQSLPVPRLSAGRRR